MWKHRTVLAWARQRKVRGHQLSGRQPRSFQVASVLPKLQDDSNADARKKARRGGNYDSDFLVVWSFYVQRESTTDQVVGRCSPADRCTTCCTFFSQNGFRSPTICRPSVISGERSEMRIAEGAVLAISRALAPILPKKFHVNPAPVTAASLLHSVVTARPGCRWVFAEELN